MWQLCKSDYILSPGFVVALLYSHCCLFSDVSCANWEKSLYVMCGHLSLFGWSSSCWSDFLKGLEPIFLSLPRGLCACCMPSTLIFSSTLSFHFLLAVALWSARGATVLCYGLSSAGTHACGLLDSLKYGWGLSEQLQASHSPGFPF